MIGYCVESVAVDAVGGRHGTFRVYVATEARAQEIVAAGPGRSYRAMPYEDMPEIPRMNLERAARERGE